MEKIVPEKVRLDIKVLLDVINFLYSIADMEGISMGDAMQACGLANTLEGYSRREDTEKDAQSSKKSMAFTSVNTPVILTASWNREYNDWLFIGDSQIRYIPDKKLKYSAFYGNIKHGDKFIVNYTWYFNGDTSKQYFAGATPYNGDALLPASELKGGDNIYASI